MGITPERLAFCIALGIAVGIIPALGITTLLCTLAAILLRLNLAAILAVNYFVHPFQIALLIPFIRAGEWLFGSRPLELSFKQIQKMFETDLLETVIGLWATTMRAIAVWLLVAPVVVAVVYSILRPLLRKLNLERITAG